MARAIDICVALFLYSFPSYYGLVFAVSYLLFADAVFDGHSIGKHFVEMPKAINDRQCGFTLLLRRSTLQNFPYALFFILIDLHIYQWLFGLFLVVPLIFLRCMRHIDS